MTFLVLGVSHRTAGVDLLDRVALDPAGVPDLLRDVVLSASVAEALVVSTCNRVEVYADVARFHGAVDDLTESLAKHSGVHRDSLGPHLYAHYDDRAVLHVFEVASGLDSLVVGEQQILGQVRAALRVAQEVGSAGRALNDLGQQALRVGKRVHAQTGIDRAGASVVSVALEVAAGHLGGLAGRRVLVVGAGAMSSLAVATLARSAPASLAVANRTPDRAGRLAAAYGADVVGLHDVPAALAGVDLVVSCTGATDVVLTVEQVAAAQRRRGGRPLVVVDLAVPRDVDPAVGGLPGVTRIDVAALAVAPGARARGDDVAAARRIVAETAAAFVAAQAAVRVEPVVVSLRARAEEVVEAELARLRLRLPGLDAATAAEIERAMRRASARLLHTPTVRVKELAADPGGQRYAEALHRLFDLGPAAGGAGLPDLPDPGTADPVSGPPPVGPPAPAADGCT